MTSAPIADGVVLSRAAWFERIERSIVMGVAFAAALLILVEVAILLVGVVARYVFTKPIVWSDELAGILFLWLTMAGVVLAYQRGQHMCIQLVSRRIYGENNRQLECCAYVVAILIFILAGYYGIEHAISES